MDATLVLMKILSPVMIHFSPLGVRLRHVPLLLLPPREQFHPRRLTSHQKGELHWSRLEARPLRRLTCNSRMARTKTSTIRSAMRLHKVCQFRHQCPRDELKDPLPVRHTLRVMITMIFMMHRQCRPRRNHRPVRRMRSAAPFYPHLLLKHQLVLPQVLREAAVLRWKL